MAVSIKNRTGYNATNDTVMVSIVWVCFKVFALMWTEVYTALGALIHQIRKICIQTLL